MAVTVFGRFKGGSCGVGAKGWTREGERIEHCVCVAFSRSCGSPNSWLAEAEFVLDRTTQSSCGPWFSGEGAPFDGCLVQSNSLKVLRLNCMIPAG
jgi:hypothetical protein